MNFLQNFEVLDILVEDSESITYRGRRLTDNLPLLITLPRSPRGEKSLRREFEITGNFAPASFHRTMELIDTGRSLLLLRPDLNDTPLSHLLKENPPAPSPLTLTLETIMRIGHRLAEALEEIHDRKVVHGNLTPDSILLQPGNLFLRLIGFAGVSNTGESDRIPSNLTCTAPELTGRIPILPDKRVDFYSAGVILYQLLAGVPPFTSTRPAELLHAHLAVRPPKLSTKLAPPGLALVVERLLAKAPEDRYQSAFALKKDLERCKTEFDLTGTICEFPTARYDSRASFRAPSRLYGRETALFTLQRAYDSCETGERKIVLLRGESGTGKTSTVQDFRHRISAGSSLFVSGKYEKNSPAPFQGITRALRELVRTILAMSPEEIEHWKGKFTELFIDYAYILAPGIPELERLVPAEEPEEEPGPAERENRFLWIMERLPGILGNKNRPLILFLDDIQWADTTSLEVMKLWTNPDNRYFLLILSFREEVRTMDSPWLPFLEVLSKGTDAEVLRFDSINPLEAREMIHDMVPLPEKDLTVFTDICLQKTGGNPFYLLQFLHSLYEDGILRFDAEGERWTWDEKDLRNGVIQDDTALWLTTRLERLAPEILSVLKLASCAGHWFSPAPLVAVEGQPQLESVDVRLERAIQGGLLIRVDSGYRFSHDRIQEALYDLLSQEEKEKNHFLLGRYLLRNPPEEPGEDWVYGTLHHFRIGFEHLPGSEHGTDFIDLTLRAVRGWKRSLAYESSLFHIVRAMELLPVDAKDTHPETYFALCQARMEAEFLIGNDREGESFFRILADRPLGPRELSHLYSLKINLHNHRMQSKAALETGSQALKSLGIRVSLHPYLDLPMELIRAKLLLRHRSIQDLEDLSPMEDERVIGAVRILMQMIPAGHLIRPELGAYLGLRMFRLTLKHGNAPSSYFAYAMYGVTLALVWEDYGAAYQFGQLSLRMSDLRKEDRTTLPDPHFGMGIFICYWKEPLKNCLGYFERGLSTSLGRADTVFAAYNAIVRVDLLFMLGLSFHRMEEILDKSDQLSRKLKNKQLDVSVAAMGIWMGVLKDGREPEKLPAQLEAHLSEDKKNASLFALLSLHHSYLMGRYEAALQWVGKLDKLPDLSGAGFHFIEYRFLRPLTLLQNMDGISTLQKMNLLRKVRSDLGKLQRWARVNPENFLHRALLVEAELNRVMGHYEESELLYDRATEAADRGGFAQNAALALELAGKCYLTRNKTRTAHTYLREAAGRYGAWGAYGKEKEIRKGLEHSGGEDEKMAPFASITLPLRSIDIDLDTLLESFLVITQEIDLDKLLAALLRYLMENAGGDFAALLLEKDGEWFVEAEANANHPHPEHHRSVPVQDHPIISPGVVSYVAHSQNQALLNRPVEQGLFVFEPVIQKRRPASLLCLPLIRQGTLNGILYLENRYTPQAFAGNRITLLNMLSTQMAGAIENARLYQSTLDLNWRIRTLLEATRNMSEASDTSGAIAIASGYILDSLHIPRRPDHLAYLPLAENREELIPRPIFPPKNPGVEWSTSTTNSLSSIPVKIAIQEDTLLIPILYKGKAEAVLSIAGMEAPPDPEQFHFFEGITDSLGLVLNHLRKQDQEKLAIVGRLASEIVHDIKNHVTLIQDRSRQMSEGEATRPHLKAIDTETTLLSRMAGDILDFTSERFLIQKQPCTSSDLKIDLEDSMGPYLRDRDISLTIDLKNNHRLHMDRERFKRVMVNLSKNAAEAMGAGGKINLQIEKEDELVYITLRDTGPGIPEEIRESLFEPFITLGKKGTGLGLAVARRIIRAHGGEITAENNRDGGACFRIVLPA